MTAVKEDIYAALSTISDAQVLDIYPKTWTKLPVIVYQEEDNKVQETSDNNHEDYSYVRFAIYIWATGSTTALACAVDAAIAPLGLIRIQCSDVDDPSGLRHKVMRYEGVIDANKYVYTAD